MAIVKPSLRLLANGPEVGIGLAGDGMAAPFAVGSELVAVELEEGLGQGLITNGDGTAELRDFG